MKKEISGLQPATKVIAADLSAYAPDSVVSRTIIKNEAGNVTSFAFAKGQGLSKHSAPFDALVHVLEGSVTITLGEEDFLLRGGEMILMPANVPHALHAEENFKMLLVMLKG